MSQSRPALIKPWLWWSILEMLLSFNTFSLQERSIAIVLKIYWCIVVYCYIEEVNKSVCIIYCYNEVNKAV